jgi:hypothetical protein
MVHIPRSALLYMDLTQLADAVASQVAWWGCCYCQAICMHIVLCSAEQILLFLTSSFISSWHIPVVVKRFRSGIFIRRSHLLPL